ncbi:conserved hypothetical protein [Candidatus Microthrix parvicella RN1]|jgi:hypothetical protein|uniref:SnoaL-like domain-containing protein n=2 Tax=Microthrixaceae TaxID=1798913 RepID=R4Z1E0_9ACTN|nr:conserved hypothetical protein [Candidatus Microthrix parvicella RN1]
MGIQGELLMEQAALDEATRHELEELKYRYLRGIDTKDWDLVADTLCQDVVGEWSGGALHYEGRAAVIGFFTEAMGRESFLSAHRVTHPELERTGERTATGIWALTDQLVDLQWQFLLQGACFYHDEYRIDPDGRWRISRTGYQRTFEHVTPLADLPGWRLTASGWENDGRSSLV